MAPKEIYELISLLVIIVIVIVLHHIYIHDNLTFPSRIFQLSDISNHETWAIAFAALAIGVFVGDIIYQKHNIV